MINSPPFSDSPSASALRAVQLTESPLHVSQVPSSSDSSDHVSPPDKLSPLPGLNAIPLSPNRSIRDEPSIIPSASSAPSLRGLLSPRPFPASAEDSRPQIAEGSTHHHVSFDGDHSSVPSPSYSSRVHVHPLLREAVSRGIDSTFTRMNHSSNPSRPSSVVRSGGGVNSHQMRHQSPSAPSSPHSRSTSPIRLFGWSGFHRTQEDPFVPVDPFQFRTRIANISFLSPDIQHHLSFDPTCEENPFCCVPPWRCTPEDRFVTFLRDTRYFFLDTLPRQMYSNLLLRLPSLYWSRIARVYEDAQLSKPDIQLMIDSYSNSRLEQQRQRIVTSSPIPPGVHIAPTLPFPDEWRTTNVSPALLRFKQSWEAFIDSLLREWKTLNLVSALLLSSVFISGFSTVNTHGIHFRAIISMFQSQVMAEDPVIRTAALLSLTSALMSLSYGCMFIVRFGTMKNMNKATRWVEEAARTTTFILWNVWVLLAMPAIWLAWSMIFFIVAIVSYVWRYGSSADPASPEPLSPTAALGPRIAVTTLFGLGLLYLVAIIKSLHNYGKTTKLFRMSTGNGQLPDISENETRGGERGSQRGRRTNHGRDGGHGGRESAQARRGRERTRGGRPEQDATEQGGLSAVTGLGLTGLEDVGSPRSLSEPPVPVEKRRQQPEEDV
ncbi:hypothetical protein JVU11DRAFT_1213 [Chiua virens]|nr:hypothetical protein JVU11DRAFT_1213 [Chiua virens]